MKDVCDFTEGKILTPLLRFAFPVLCAMLLQTMYGAVDLMITGRFASVADVSAVSTGSFLMQVITFIITDIAMGMTILLGQKIGEKKIDEGGYVIGSGCFLFFGISVFIAVSMQFLAPVFIKVLNIPEKAYLPCKAYVRICSSGAVFITAFNVIGAIFRGLGNSKLPLIVVGIACAFNVLGDLFFVAVLKMGSSGAAIATVLAQALSVTISFFIIQRVKLPFVFSWKNLKWNKRYASEIFGLGSPIALQDLLVSISFLAITAIVNSMGLIVSAGIGIAERICGFIMLVPSSYMQAISAFVAQNYGGGKMDRAKKAVFYGIATSLIVGIFMFFSAFFFGDRMCRLFSDDSGVVFSGFQYLRAYAIDCLFTSFLFCFIGFYNGIGRTKFVMWQGILGAFAVRIPVSYVFSKMEPVSIFKIGLATPCSSLLQITLCMLYLLFVEKSLKKEKLANL